MARAATSSAAGLPRSTPEAQGVASRQILDFLAAMAETSFEPHSFMFLRHGHVIAEAWWAPYRRDTVHRLYSGAKSFTSAAIGFAIAEGRIKLNDKVAAFFPDKMPRLVSDNLALLEIEHLLIMADGQPRGSGMKVVLEEDWLQAYFAQPFEARPGTRFAYNTTASYVLSAIVQKVSGQRMIDYLKPRLFDPLGSTGQSWETCPRGIDVGGMGLSTTTEAFARFGQLYLDRGKWQGRQLLPAEWVAASTRGHIQPPLDWNRAPSGESDPLASRIRLEALKRTNSDYQPYGYHFRGHLHGGFAASGAFGQICVVLPHLETVIAITGTTGPHVPGMASASHYVTELMWRYLLVDLQPAARPADAGAAGELGRYIATRRLPCELGGDTPPGRPASEQFTIDPNPMGATTIRFDHAPGSCTATLAFDQGRAGIRCGHGAWLDGSLEVPGYSIELPGLARAVKPPGPVAVAGCFAWKDATTLRMQWQYRETPHRDVVTCRLDGDAIEIEFSEGVTPRPTLKGRRT